VNIEILDTSLRDGAQGEGINFSIQDKLAVARALDELGTAWIEAGSPGSNPKDAEFFRAARGLSLKTSRLCAFGPTHRIGVRCENDAQIRSLLDAEAEALTVFGKSWDLHVRDVLRVSLEENLEIIYETVAFLKEKGRLVFFDAEHFFDGMKENPAYALKTIEAAAQAGADRIVLCDTNGGSLPEDAAAAVKSALQTLDGGGAGNSAKAELPGVGGPDSRAGTCAAEVRKQAPPLGIHAHNDAGLAVAVSLAAVQAGCVHVQGTLAGFGERCGNASLAALIPGLELKLGRRCLPEGKLPLISGITRQIAEIANISLAAASPYVGSSAFSHKGGMHSDGVLKVSRSFEHIDPGMVGNVRHLLMSEVGGRAAVAERIKKIDPSLTKDHPAAAEIAGQLKMMEADGWAFDGADASFELMVRRKLRGQESPFRILAYRVMSEHPTGRWIACSHAWTKVRVDGQDEIAAAEGNGPVNALDGALRRALARFYPELESMRLIDYKVRVIDGGAATAAKVRVLIESTDGPHSWATIGVSEDIIDASRAALADSIEYKLLLHSGN
jgi:2-isopropylmalate synthase